MKKKKQYSDETFNFHLKVYQVVVTRPIPEIQMKCKTRFVGKYYTKCMETALAYIEKYLLHNLYIMYPFFFKENFYKF